MADEQPTIQSERSGPLSRLFVEHPRSLGMTWAGHGVGAVKIGARADRRGLCVQSSMPLVPAWFTETAGRTVTRIYDHIAEAQGGRCQTRKTGRTMKSDRRCRSRLSVADFRGRCSRRSWRGAASPRC